MSTTKSSSVTSHARKVLAHQEQQAAGDPGEHQEAAMPDAAFVSDAAMEVVKRVTTPVLSFPTGATYVLRILEGIRVSDVEDSKFGPARVCEVEAPNGEVRLLITGEVLATALTRSYPNEGYVGAWFQITKLPPKEGKRYADYSIVEIRGPARLKAAE